MRPRWEPLRLRIRAIAQARVSWGFRPVLTPLRREGWRVNHKLVLPLYREEGQALRRRRPKRRRATMERAGGPTVGRVNKRWAMEFMHDSLANGQILRIFAAIDVQTWECVALRAGKGFRGGDVATTLSAAE